MLRLYYLLHEQYAVNLLLSRLEDSYVFLYQYWRRPLLLVQVNVEQNNVTFFYVFTHLITQH
jgi:hypothetical protein